MSFNKQASLAVQDCNLSKCDRCVLNFISPYLQHDGDGNPTCKALQPILAQVKQVLEEGGIVCINTEGQVQFMNQQAIELFSRYFAWSQSCTLPDVINRWFECQIAQNVDFIAEKLKSPRKIRSKVRRVNERHSHQKSSTLESY
jgi:hypothetical protein